MSNQTILLYLLLFFVGVALNLRHAGLLGSRRGRGSQTSHSPHHGDSGGGPWSWDGGGDSCGGAGGDCGGGGGGD
ncbi:MAG: hypothetical protein AB7E80_13535 [Hyphomicrobiaceae bacterium]